MAQQQKLPPFPHTDWIFDPTTCLKHALEGGYLIRHQDIVTVNSILTSVTNHFDVPRELVMGEKRTKGIIEARHAFRVITKEKTNLTYAMIGTLHGKVNHTTIMHSVEVHMAMIEMCDRNKDYCDYANRYGEIANSIKKIDDEENFRFLKKKFLERFMEFLIKNKSEDPIGVFLDQDQSLNEFLFKAG